MEEIPEPTSTSIPPGSVIERVYWQVPRKYGMGSEFSSQLEAIREGIRLTEQAMEDHRAYFAPEPMWKYYSPLPQVFVVDLRWLVRLPEGMSPSSYDFVMVRKTFKDLKEARFFLAKAESLSRLRTEETTNE